MTGPRSEPQASAPVRPEIDPAVPDAVLAVRARSGDHAAFELIMRRHNQRLYRLALGIVRDPSEAEDVVQEAYIRAYTKLDGFQGPDGLSAWLGRIASNEALGRLRRGKRLVALDDAPPDAAETSNVVPLGSALPADPERLAANGELRQLIERAVGELPDDFRAVFMLRAVEGLSVAETAAHLDLEQATVKTRFHRARTRLRAALGDEIEALMPEAFKFAGARCDRIVAGVLARLPLA